MIFRTAVYEVRTGIYSAPGGSGVRGAPHRLQAVRPPTRLPAVISRQPVLNILSEHCLSTKRHYLK